MHHKSVRFWWVPSHVGIPSNEQADALACSATISTPTPFIMCSSHWSLSLLQDFHLCPLGVLRVSSSRTLISCHILSHPCVPSHAIFLFQLHPLSCPHSTSFDNVFSSLRYIDTLSPFAINHPIPKPLFSIQYYWEYCMCNTLNH